MEKLFKAGGIVEKYIQKALGPVFSLCCCARRGAVLLRAQSFHAHAIENNGTKFKTLRWRLLRWRLTRSVTKNRPFEKCPCQCSFVYPYPSVSDLAGENSDHSPRKTRTKTQTTPDSVFIRERRNSDHGLSFPSPWSEFSLFLG